MPDPKDDESPFEKRDTEKMTPLPPIRPRRRSSPPNPAQDRFLQTLASKVARVKDEAE